MAQYDPGVEIWSLLSCSSKILTRASRLEHQMGFKLGKVDLSMSVA
jgi:hypothetical protein